MATTRTIATEASPLRLQGKKVSDTLQALRGGVPVNPLPPRRDRDPTVPHAPNRTPNLTRKQEKVGVYSSSTKTPTPQTLYGRFSSP